MNLKEKSKKSENLKRNKITMKKLKKQVKRNYTYSFSSNNNSFTNTCRSSNKLDNRTEWNI